jgi:DNA polymerase I-like protein with 3'-5' exonuclease and polymerase domains
MVIDVATAKKLLVGRPKRDFAGTRPPWDLWELFGPYLNEEDRSPAVQRYLATQLAAPDVGVLEDSVVPCRLLEALSRLWKDLQGGLSASGEDRRFFEVEVPVYNIMLRSQYRGIGIDEVQRTEFAEQIDKTYVSSHHKLAIGYGMNVERAFRDVTYLLRVLKLNHYGSDSAFSSEEIIDIHKDSDDRCRLLHNIRSAKRNKAILFRTSSEKAGKCFPVFDTMGTVSGRILAVDPHLQYLKKTYRSIVSPLPGMTLLYADYSQFEPTILANVSGDERLTALCAAGDLYTTLAVEIYGNPELRKEAKTLFLAYSYGMGKQGLVKQVCQVLQDNRRAIEAVRAAIIRAFDGVERWKQQLYQELQGAGRIGTGSGNYRNRSASGELARTEKRWAVSQVVQGTGALILKCLIMRIAASLPRASILLPMHDALLFEVPEEESDQMAESVLQHYDKAFLEVCPGIKPKVRMEPFARD